VERRCKQCKQLYYLTLTLTLICSSLHCAGGDLNAAASMFEGIMLSGPDVPVRTPLTPPCAARSEACVSDRLSGLNAPRRQQLSITVEAESDPRLMFPDVSFRFQRAAGRKRIRGTAPYTTTTVAS